MLVFFLLVYAASVFFARSVQEFLKVQSSDLLIHLIKKGYLRSEVLSK